MSESKFGPNSIEERGGRDAYKILLIDDDPAIAGAIQDKLSGRGLTNVVIAHNSADAVQHLNSRFDAIVVDVMLDRPDGTLGRSKNGDEWLLEHVAAMNNTLFAVATAYPNLIADPRALAEHNIRIVTKGSSEEDRFFAELERHADEMFGRADTADGARLSASLIANAVASDDAFLRGRGTASDTSPSKPVLESLSFGAATTDAGLIIPRVIDSTRLLADKLLKEPSSIFELPPRRFEELIAELVRQFGWQVELTPATRDGGRDIVAIVPSELGNLLCVIEAKRYRQDRKVGVELVRQLWGTISHDDASMGVLVTSSTFSSEAKEFQRQHRFRLHLKDNGDVFGWLRTYNNTIGPGGHAA